MTGDQSFLLSKSFKAWKAWNIAAHSTKSAGISGDMRPMIERMLREPNGASLDDAFGSIEGGIGTFRHKYWSLSALKTPWKRVGQTRRC